MIANYKPQTNVAEHAKVDLDMKEINDLVGKDAVTQADFTAAHTVYESGGNGGKGNSVKGSGSIRTLKGFATSGAAKMSKEKWWVIYKNYWGDDNYADTYVQEAFTGSGVIGGKSNSMRAEIAKKGVAYQAVWMYVIHEFEDAVSDCLSGNIFDNAAANKVGDAPIAWDEGWAFYAGSLEGADGSGSGAMIHTLAEKRCKDFGTCADGRTGAAKVNQKMLAMTKHGRDKIKILDCYGAQVELDGIVDQMTVPLIQGMLKYAYKADPKNEGGVCKTAGSTCDKAWAEGWAFAAAVLPRLAYCSTKDNAVAKMVKDNLDVIVAAQMKDGYVKLKTNVESLYECMGITCADVGAFQNSDGVYSGMEACLDPTTAPAAAAAVATAAPVAEDSFAALLGFTLLLLNA
jgi:hypothetical protein